MKCFLCGSNTTVTETRRTNDGRPYRYRACTECDGRFKTYEINEVDLLNMLDDYLPERLVDEISHGLSNGISKLKNDKGY